MFLSLFGFVFFGLKCPFDSLPGLMSDFEFLFALFCLKCFKITPLFNFVCKQVMLLCSSFF